MANDEDEHPKPPITRLRFAGKNERRCIMRQALGFYQNVIIGGYYHQTPSQSSTNADELDINQFIPALKYCIDFNPPLSAAIKGDLTEVPELVRPNVLDLRNHIQIVSLALATPRRVKDEQARLKHLIAQNHDESFENIDTVPQWKIVVVPLSKESGTDDNRMFIAFVFSHDLGDGTAGLAFHRTFIHGLNSFGSRYDTKPHSPSPSIPLPPTAEEAGNFYITWGYLLAPFMGAYLPKAIARFFNLRASATPEPADMWRPTTITYDPNDFHTGIETLTIDAETIRTFLKVCRANNAKLTGSIHQLIVRALSRIVPTDALASTFVAQTATNLRKLIPALSDNDIANCSSGVYEIIPRVDDADAGDSAKFWEAARTSTENLARGTESLTDQPVGLLRYLAHFKMWLEGQIGKKRDASYELSNIMCFDPETKSGNAEEVKREKEMEGTSGHSQTWTVGSMYFSQPASVTGAALVFNVVSRKGGDLIMAVNWQKGMLGLGSSEEEQDFVSKICESIGDRMRHIASAL